MSQAGKHITIIGAGMAGCFMAIVLAKRGYTVDIYERYSQKQLTQEATNRSFNLTFYYRGIQALKQAGIWNAVKPLFRVLRGSTVHSNFHKDIFIPFETEKKPQFTLERPEMLHVLLQKAMAQKNIRFHFQTALVSINKWEKTITIQNNRSKKLKTITCSVVIGADGVHSVVRPFLQQGQEAKHSQTYLSWTYKQVTISRDAAEVLGWKENTQHFVHGKDALFIAFPNKNMSFTAMMLLPKTGKYTFKKLKTNLDIHNFLNDRFPRLSPAHDLFINSLVTHPEGQLVTIKTEPWFYKDFLVLIGDAAHGVLPFYGQGTTAAFEDCLEIDRLLKVHGEQWETIFSNYQTNRKKDTDVLAHLSQDSFNRLNRYRRADIVAVENRLDSILHSIAPKLWLAPLPKLISDEQEHFHSLFERHNKRRKVATFIGLGAVAHLIYFGLLMKENLSKKQEDTAFCTSTVCFR